MYRKAGSMWWDADEIGRWTLEVRSQQSAVKVLGKVKKLGRILDSHEE